MVGFGDLNGIFTSKKVSAEPQKATVVFVQADRMCLNLVLFLQQLLRTKTTALGFVTVHT